MTGHFRKRIKRGGRIRGCDQVAIVDLAVQCSRGLPDPQPSLTAAVADHVGRQLVHGQDRVPGPAIRQSRLPGQNQHFRPQNGQRGRAEHKVEELRDTIAGYSFYLAVTGHLRREFPRTSAR